MRLDQCLTARIPQYSLSGTALRSLALVVIFKTTGMSLMFSQS